MTSVWSLIESLDQVLKLRESGLFARGRDDCIFEKVSVTASFILITSEADLS